MLDLINQSLLPLLAQAILTFLITLLLVLFVKPTSFSITGLQKALISLAVTLLFLISSVEQIYQTRRMIQSINLPGAPEALQSPLNRKAEFLALVDQLAGNPQQITDELRKKLFDQFKTLFPAGPADMALYRDEIKKSYLCHVVLYQDLLDTMETKTPVKSLQTQMCETYSGEFFNRPKLYLDEVLKVHEQELKNPPEKKVVMTKLEQLKTRLQSIDQIFR